ncbi:MAG: restriction endonuclease subunit S [Chitinophagales bacterium]
MNLKEVEIKDAFDVVSGSTPSSTVEEYWTNGSIKWITPTDLSKLKSPFIKNTARRITDKGLKNCSANLIPRNSIIISTRAPIGYVAVLKDEMTCNQGCKALVAKNGNIDSVFAYYLVNTKVEEMKRLGSGSTFKEISKAKLETIKIHLPDLKTQQKIAGILEQADAARQKRKQANQLTEAFLQSAFLEMFGDPVRNEKGWEVKDFGEIASIEKDTVQSHNISDKDFYVGLEHIEKDTGNLLDYQKTSEIDLKSTKFKFSSDHILYGKLRSYLNKVCFPNISGICSTDILPIKAKDKISNKYFIGYLMKQPFFIDKATSMSNGANLPRISPKTLETFQIILPPLPLQKKFATLVEQVEQLQVKQRESEKELENLFQSLMQRYFG